MNLVAPPVPHTQILASAGSGKTYQLTHRFIHLMALGVEPQRILALTFTRKAAGEFFSAILTKLAEAARDPEKARLMAVDFQMPQADCFFFLGLLQQLVDALSQLNLGTLDGFFHRILSTYAMEFGLGGPFELLDETLIPVERQDVYRQLFQRNGEGGSPNAREAFLEGFRLATFGAEEKSLLSKLDAFIQQNHPLRIEADASAQWGNARRIWSSDQPDWEAARNRQSHLHLLRGDFGSWSTSKSMQQKWEAFFDDIEIWSPGLSLGRPTQTLLSRIRERRDALLGGEAEIVYNRAKSVISGEAARALAGLADGLLAEALNRHLEITRGIYAVVGGYEAIYDNRVRARGRLTFSDIQHTLNGTGPALSLEEQDAADREATRLEIQYRLDARFDHWLLDEFQDTSVEQWQILQPLIDEVVMDPSGRRSFFYVGDVKQAIYGWRGGDSRLFQRVAERYHPAIESRSLETSFRSCPEVIACVNAVFGRPDVLEKLFPTEACRRWAAAWGEHSSQRSEVAGHSAWICLPPEASRYDALLPVLRKVRPLERGLSCAILVQRNAQVSEVVQVIRQKSDIPVAEEKAVPIATDHPLGQLFLALMSAVVHPDDGFSRGVIRMSPFPLQNEEWPAFRRHCLRQIAVRGFAGVFDEWIQKMSPWTGDAYTRGRAEALLAAAERYDATGDRNPDRFLAWLRASSERVAEAAGVVRVMTIHQSKGLGFDLVICPELEGNDLAIDRKGLAVERDLDNRVNWVLHMPPQDVVEADPALSRIRRRQRAEACYEKFCLFYVALTRAKRGLILLTTERKPTASSPNYIAWLEAVLTGKPRPAESAFPGLDGTLLWEAGEAGWADSIPEVPAFSADTPIHLPADLPPPIHPRLERRRPASASESPPHAQTPFATRTREALDFGSRVHAAFEALARYPDLRAADAALDAWLHSGRGLPHPLDREAVAVVRRALQDPAIGPWFIGPAERGEHIWRERAFERAVDGIWISGVFDRVHFIGDPETGITTGATILDFKTNRLENPSAAETAAQHYEGQLNAYRDALAQATGLPRGQIRTALVFTDLPLLVDLK